MDNHITFLPRRSIYEIIAIFSGNEFKRTSFKLKRKKEKKIVVCCSLPLKRETFQAVVVPQLPRTKKRDAPYCLKALQTPLFEELSNVQKYSHFLYRKTFLIVLRDILKWLLKP